MKLTDIQKKQIEDELAAYTNDCAGKTREERKLKGQFFTPAKLVIRMLETFDCEEPGDQTILDPTAGNGNLLIGALIAGFKPENVYGNELDPEIYEMLVKRLAKYGVPKENLANMDCLSDDFKDWCKAMFDLIIANPPYGKAGRIAKDIIRSICIHSDFKEFVCLANLTTFRKVNEYVLEGSVQKITEPLFEDADIIGSALAKIRKEAGIKKGVITWTRETLDGKQLQLFDAVTKYNKTHECVWQSFYARPAVESQLGNRERMFAATWWTPHEGVHTTEKSTDQQFNLYGNTDLKSLSYTIIALLWPTKQERDNFCNWWYSCLKSDNPHSGLTNAFLKVLSVNHSCRGFEIYKYFFPNLDWSRPWTDKEILKEIGLPEDFLEMH